VRGAVLVGARPSLWTTAARQARRLARPEWWRRPPFLPVPDREYLEFRFATQYGTESAVRPDPRDLVTYLEWCREMPEPRHLARHRR
jgi:hypothetical protein